MSAFVNSQHALESGWILGYLLKKEVHAEPVKDEEGNYTDVIQIDVPLGDGFVQEIKIQVLP